MFFGGGKAKKPASGVIAPKEGGKNGKARSSTWSILQGALVDIFGYETPKKVIIQDPWVGFVRFLGVLAVLVYLAAGRLYLDKAYLWTERITGIVQTSLQSPGELPATDTLSYCDGGTNVAMKALPCVTGSAPWVMAPSTGGGEVFVSTRVKTGTLDNNTFITQPESYTVGVTFSVQAMGMFARTGRSHFAKTTAELETRLLDETGAPTNAVTRVGMSDIVSVGALMDAAGMTGLDAPHDGDFSVSYRYGGVVLMVSIDCPMDHHGTVVRCDYRVRQLPKAMAMMRILGADGQDFVAQERHGIKIVFQATGVMGEFHFPTLLVTCVCTLSMVTVSTVLIELLLRYVLPLKKIYNLVLIEESPDFVAVRAGTTRSKERVWRLKHRKQYMAGDKLQPIHMQVGKGERQPGGPRRNLDGTAASPRPQISPSAASTGVETPQQNAYLGQNPDTTQASTISQQRTGWNSPVLEEDYGAGVGQYGQQVASEADVDSVGGGGGWLSPPAAYDEMGAEESF